MRSARCANPILAKSRKSKAVRIHRDFSDMAPPCVGTQYPLKPCGASVASRYDELCVKVPELAWLVFFYYPPAFVKQKCWRLQQLNDTREQVLSLATHRG